jgi:hypothetical protein
MKKLGPIIRCSTRRNLEHPRPDPRASQPIAQVHLMELELLPTVRQAHAMKDKYVRTRDYTTTNSRYDQVK